jgi:hypothetical protein
MRKLLLALVACLGVVGCAERHAYAQPVVVVEAPMSEEVVTVATLPPPPHREVVHVSPGRNYVWAHGHWHWTNRWVWVPGRYVVRVPGRVWVGPRYYYRGRTVVYARGYWRR